MSKIIGIDLGTSTSEVAYIKDGKPYIIKNKLGEEIILSILSVGLDDEWIVGSEAKARALLYPNDTIMEVKRLMGSDEKIKLKGILYTPEEVSSEILKYLKKNAEIEIGQAIEKAVITVPAYFSDKQRKATVKAADLAGFQVERIINEPTAAALAYGIEHMSSEENILIYDLGGGTFDVTLLEMFDGILDVKASSGKNDLGGKDFDEKIIDYLLKKFNDKNEIDLSLDIRAMIKIKREAEKCKIALSNQEEYIISIPFIAEKDGLPIEIHEKITRKEFEELIVDLVKSTGEAINIVLEDSKVSKEDIDLILLVGGSTKVPFVATFVEEFLGQCPKELINPDLAVAQGAAIQAGIIDELFDSEEGIFITDVCPYALGIEIVRESFGYLQNDIMDILIARNTTVPVTVGKIYVTASDYQEDVDISIYQGDNMIASNNEFIEMVRLSGIPENEAGLEKVKVEFSYDINGMLDVKGTIMSTGKNAEISINMMDVKVNNEINLDDWVNSPRAKEFRAIIRKAERLIDKNEDFEVLIELIEDFKLALIKENDNLIGDIEEEIVDFITSSKKTKSK